jgi:hypothetical protein
MVVSYFIYGTKKICILYKISIFYTILNNIIIYVSGCYFYFSSQHAIELKPLHPFPPKGWTKKNKNTRFHNISYLNFLMVREIGVGVNYICKRYINACIHQGLNPRHHGNLLRS